MTQLPEKNRIMVPHLCQKDSVHPTHCPRSAIFIIGGELYKSSTSSMAIMQPVWNQLSARHLNTALAAVSWELVVPQEGQFHHGHWVPGRRLNGDETGSGHWWRFNDFSDNENHELTRNKASGISCRTVSR